MRAEDVAIVGALRTPVGAMNGIYKSISASRLGEIIIRELLKRTNLSGSEISEVILGQIINAGCGPNPARQAAMNAGLPVTVPASLINQLCGSALVAIGRGYQAIRAADAGIIIAGGQENMTRSPHMMPMRGEWGEQGARWMDTLQKDALIDPFHNIHTVTTAENIAREFNITREEQDRFAANSYHKYLDARKQGKFLEETVPVETGNNSFDEDEIPRLETTLEHLSKLKPAMQREGTVTAGNASGISDGAAMVVLMTVQNAWKRGLKPMAVIKSWANVGVEPAIMGTAPVPASRTALAKAGWKVEELDIIEANESFASQAIYVNRQMQWDTDRVNINGGAIAMGHPFGAAGARILTTLLYEMERQKATKALATLCVGGGMGVAMCVERMQ